MIEYRDTPEDLSADQLTGFFEGWPQPPSPETHLEILRRSTHVIVAFDTEGERVIGFITAISDGVLAAYISLLEVLPDYRGRDIGSELVRRMLAQLAHLYMVDLVCDPPLARFYEKFGWSQLAGMAWRNGDARIGDGSR